MRKKLREMSKQEHERERTWVLVEIALVLLAAVLLESGFRGWGGVVAGLFVLAILRRSGSTT